MMLLSNSIWACEPRTLDMLSVGPRAAVTPQTNSARMDGAEMVIPLRGLLVRGLDDWASFFGVEQTSYDGIGASIDTALASNDVRSILLDVDSPGGDAQGLIALADKIHAANAVKPVVARVSGMCCSAAYYLASQAARIIAEPDAIVGSIGVYSLLYDTSGQAEKMGIKAVAVRSGEQKAAGEYGIPITDEQIATARAVVDGLAAGFLQAVSRGRNLSEERTKELATGAYWLAPDAKGLGLIDGLSNEKMLDAGRKGKGKSRMNDEEIKAAIEQAANDARAAERARFGALRAAFPEHPAFAAEQFEAGATVEQAKASYSDVLKADAAALAEANAALLAENETLKAKAAEAEQKAQAPGAPGVPMTSAPSTGDFMALVKEKAKSENIGEGAAVRALAKEHPELHRAYVANLRGGKES